MNTPFTDYLGNPINDGDVIVYPTAAGSSSADMNVAVVKEIDPIVEELGSPSLYCYASMRTKANHATVPFPTNNVENDDPNGPKWKRVPAPERAYGLKVRKLKDGRREFGKLSFENPERIFTLRNVDRVTVVTSLCDDETLARAASLAAR